MWIPVLEARALRDEPVRVTYWGTPVVLFRTGSGGIGALEDRCAHRGAPLSCGVVRGDSIRCPFHHFAFDAAGACSAVPPAYREHARPDRYRVARYHARLALGLVWISVEEEASAPFPLAGDEPEAAHIVTGSFEVDGDLRVWMDHFLDATHCLWTHAQTTYGGSPDAPARLESVAIDIAPGSEYPVRSAVRMVYDLAEQRGGRSSYSLALSLASGVARIRRALRLRRRRSSIAARHLEIRADLLTPLAQYTRTIYRSGTREHRYDSVTAINPIADGKSTFLFAGFFRDPAPGPLAGWIRRSFLEQIVPRHLGIEDGRILARTPFIPRADLQDTPLDATVVAMRSMFARYLERKGHLYGPTSLIHTLAYT